MTSCGLPLPCLGVGAVALGDFPPLRRWRKSAPTGDSPSWRRAEFHGTTHSSHFPRAPARSWANWSCPGRRSPAESHRMIGGAVVVTNFKPLGDVRNCEALSCRIGSRASCRAAGLRAPSRIHTEAIPSSVVTVIVMKCPTGARCGWRCGPWARGLPTRWGAEAFRPHPILLADARGAASPNTLQEPVAEAAMEGDLPDVAEEFRIAREGRAYWAWSVHERGPPLAAVAVDRGGQAPKRTPASTCPCREALTHRLHLLPAGRRPRRSIFSRNRPPLSSPTWP